MFKSTIVVFGSECVKWLRSVGAATGSNMIFVGSIDGSVHI
jgi:hypothetical protein